MHIVLSLLMVVHFKKKSMMGDIWCVPSVTRPNNPLSLRVDAFMVQIHQTYKKELTMTRGWLLCCPTLPVSQQKGCTWHTPKTAAHCQLSCTSAPAWKEMTLHTTRESLFIIQKANLEDSGLQISKLLWQRLFINYVWWTVANGTGEEAEAKKYKESAITG